MKRFHFGGKGKIRKCLFCPKAFVTNFELDLHILAHIGETPYKCETCGRMFATTYGLKGHQLRQHTKQKPFKCPEECGKTFVSKIELVRHQRTHNGTRPYSCLFRNREFARLGNFKCHIIAHIGERSFVCSTCNRYFATSGGRREHQRRQHTKEKPFTCAECLSNGIRIKNRIRTPTENAHWCETTPVDILQQRILQILIFKWPHQNSRKGNTVYATNLASLRAHI